MEAVQPWNQLLEEDSWTNSLAENRDETDLLILMAKQQKKLTLISCPDLFLGRRRWVNLDLNPSQSH